MVIALGLPNNYPFVVGAAAAAPLLTVWQSLLVSRARKLAGIKYPQMYATKEEESLSPSARKYNCTQRAHQNTLENLSQFYVSLFIAGIDFPRVATGAAATWLVGRVLYTTGYTSGDPAKRTPGAIMSSLSILVLLGTSLASAYNLVAGTGFNF